MFMKEKIRCRCLRLTLLPYRVPAAFPHRPWVDTSYNAVIQKSCYRASGNEIQWVQLQSYFPECHQYTLFFLRFVLTQWIIIAPLKTCASQKAPGSHIPRYVSAIIHRSFPSAGQTHGAGTPKHIHTLVHACMRACVHACGNVLTLRLICPYDATQRLMVLCNPACFNVFWGAQTCCIYRENSHRSHSLTGCRWGRFPSQW